MEREGNKLSIFKIEKISIFPHDAPKFGFGDGKKWGKSIWKEREKVFVLTNCCTLLSLFSAFQIRFFVYHDLVMTLSS